MKKLSWVVLSLMMSACATRTVKIVDATWVSMKNPSPPGPQEKLSKVANVSEEYCLDAWSGSYGLMDELVKKTESKYQIDYIKYPSFTKTVGQNCVQLVGEGYRVAR